MKQHEHAAAPSAANPWMFVSLFIGALLVASFVTNIYLVNKVIDMPGTQGGAFAPTPSAPSPSAPAAPAAPTRVNLENPREAPVLGNANAPVTIVEFSDFQCPFCARFYTQSMGEIKKNYVDTGKAKIVFRHLPLPFHPLAAPAAEASMCAHDQGKFWEYHNAIFENQASLSEANLRTWAQQVGLNMATFDSCYNSGKYKEYVAADAAAAGTVGISGTPSFTVNGQLVVGAQPYSVFAQAIDAALAG